MTAPTSSLPVDYDAPPVNPIGVGLFSAATLIDTTGPTRFMPSGVSIRPRNCADGWGTWDVDPCADPGTKTKHGDRPAAGDPFAPLVVWGYDECGPLENFSEYEARALQNARLHEQGLAEAHFGARLLADAAAPTTVADVVAAVSALETALGEAGFYGTIHASTRFAAYAAQANQIIRSSGSPVLRTPLGHTWAFGAGYEDVLDGTLVATGPVTVWRDAWTQRSALDERHNIKAAIAERAIVIGYECLVSAVTVS